MISYKSVIDSGLCLGCGACTGGSGGVKVGLNGFYIPINSDLLNEPANLCPSVNIKKNRASKNEVMQYFPEIGEFVNVYIGWSNDNVIRKLGSSGGVVSGILVNLLKNNDVDYVVQAGVCDDDPLLVIRKIVTSFDEILNNSGSRYAPVSLLEKIGEIFEKPGRFAFVGKPCDIIGLNKFLETHQEYKSKVFVKVALMCAGIPSFNATDKILNNFGLLRKDVAKFRYRGNGWPGNATAIELNGRVHAMSYQDSWGEILGRDINTRCRLCPDGMGEFADIVCGDAWHGKDGYPDFNEDAGRNLIISRSIVGDNILKKLSAYGCIEVNPVDAKIIFEMQPYQITRRRVIIARLVAYFAVFRINPGFYGFNLVKAAINGGYRLSLSNLIGSYKRFLKRS